MKSTAQKKYRADPRLLLVIGSLLLIGLIMIVNSTAISSNNLYGDPYRFAFYQAGWILIGGIGFMFFYNVDYTNLEKFSNVFFYVTLGLLGLLAVIGLGHCGGGFGFAPCINGANRWLFINPPPLPKIPLLGVLGFQPGEMAKLSLILFLSFQLVKRIKENNKPFNFYLMFTGITAMLIILEPNMSTALIVFGLGTALYFASGAPLKPLLYMIPLGLVLALFFMISSPYRRDRVMTYLKGSHGLENKEDYHAKQILIALGSGGFTGVGFGQSKQKYQYLPEVASDSIFAIIGEEFGFIGTSFILGLICYLIYLGFSTAKNARDTEGRLIATGIISWFGIQALVNVAAMAQLIPLTGVPIPLISYGGSSMVFSLMGLGLLANISKYKV